MSHRNNSRTTIDMDEVDGEYLMEELEDQDESGLEDSANTGKRPAHISWTAEQSKFLMKQYHKYEKLRRFKTKKDMWMQISSDLLLEMQVQRSAEKCNDRFKSMRFAEQRRKQRQLESMAMQNAHVDQTAEQQQDDQQLKQGVNYEVIFVNDRKETAPATAASDTNKAMSGVMLLRSTMLEIHRRTEDSNERRHQELLAADERRHQQLLQNIERHHQEMVALKTKFH